MIEALISGKLASDPAERTASNGNPFWVATVRVPAGDDALFVSIVTFSRTAGERLAALAKGAAVACAGTLEPTEWTDREGNVHAGWRMVVAEILSVHQARKRRDAEGARDA